LLKGFKPVNWCSDCGSALAEAEVEYQDKKSIAIDVKFAFANHDIYTVFGAQAHQGKPVSIVIWTTTPWTIPANEAVSVHPTLEYALVWLKESNEVLLLAADLVNDAMSRYGISEFEVIGNAKGDQFGQVEGQDAAPFVVQHPFMRNQD